MSDEPKDKAKKDSLKAMEHIQYRVLSAKRGKHGYKITRLTNTDYGYLGLLVSLMKKELNRNDNADNGR